MSINISHKEKMDSAIVNKVMSVLANAKYTQSIKIKIEGKVGEAPLIDYRITEVIVPESEDENDSTRSN